ncbi:stage II sporulation protein M [Candidatus Woesearchaeota archaeon]|jgi:uncharacterized membrane protein SpoIIM required for sporulation|nr:stage II sporulation protein M [Candidatus Woesearchaeota archaeon]
MVLESIIKPLQAEKKPWEMFFYGMIVASIGLFLGYWIFKDRADLVMVFLTTFACISIMFHTIRAEEKKDIVLEGEGSILKEHSKLIAFFSFLFLGTMVAWVIWYVVLPTGMTNMLFNQQVSTITEINNPIKGHVTGFAANIGLFNKIFFNNVKVMIFCILFSFFYGSGAIFILMWNSSVVAAAMGGIIRGELAKYTSFGFDSFIAATQISTYSFFRYMIHGLPEMIAYMIAGLAGGIISVAVIRHDLEEDKFQKIMFDSSTLLLLAIFVLLVAGLIEAFITPVLF